MSKLAHLEWNKILPWGIKSPLLSATLRTPSFSSILYPPWPSLDGRGERNYLCYPQPSQCFPSQFKWIDMHTKGNIWQEWRSIAWDEQYNTGWFTKTLKLFWVPQDTQDIGIRISLHQQCQLMFFLWRLTLSSGVTAQLLGMTCFSLSLYLRSATLPQFPGLCLCRPSDNFLSSFLRSVSWPQTLDFSSFNFEEMGTLKQAHQFLQGMEWSQK